MECLEAEQQLVPYLLDALDATERSRVDYHVEHCAGCSSKLLEDGDLVAQLAYAVPQVHPPSRVKRELFSRIDGRESRRELSGILSLFGQKLVAQGGMAVASLLMALVVFGGVWLNNQLNRIGEEQQALATQLAASQDASDIIDTAGDLNLGVHTAGDLNLGVRRPAVPVYPVKTLTATRPSDTSRAIVMLSVSGDTATIYAIGLPLVSYGVSYQVWLVEDSYRLDAGIFTVDSNGYGQLEIELSGPLRNYDAIYITPKGDIRSVLRRDL